MPLTIEDARDLSFEMTAARFTETGFRNLEVGAQLQVWARFDGRGRAADSSAGYVLGEGALRSPDASWLLKERIRALDKENRQGFYRLCPDFVIELQSGADCLTALRGKMDEWIANGAQLAWLIDPSRRAVEVFRRGRAGDMRENPARVEGEGLVAGFVLDLRPVWQDQSE